MILDFKFDEWFGLYTCRAKCVKKIIKLYGSKMAAGSAFK